MYIRKHGFNVNSEILCIYTATIVRMSPIKLTSDFKVVFSSC